MKTPIRNLQVFLRHTDLFLLAAILLVSILLRTIHLLERISWQDTGTELLVAYHVAHFGEYPLLGVHAASINFVHPPWYLYGLGLAMRLFHDYVPIIYLSAIAHALTVVPIFLIGLWLFGRHVGLIAALLYATSSWATSLAWTMQSQNIIVPIGTWAVMLWLYARRKRKILLLIFSVVFLLFAVTVNYAAFFLLPLPFFLGVIDRKRSWFDIFVWVLIWLFYLVMFFSPLFLYFGSVKTLMTLGSMPFQFLTKGSAPMPHHFNLLAPLVSLFVSWALVLLWRRYRNFWWRALVVIGATGVIVANLIEAYAHEKGDYQDTLACSQAVIQAMQKTINDSPRVVIKDPEHKDKWDHMTVLFELALGKKLVTLGPKRDYFYWPKRNKNIYLLCMGSKPEDEFLTKTCSQEFAAHNLSYQLSGQMPQVTSFPCRVYRFDRHDL